MGPPGGGRNSVTPRYLRHFNTVYIEPYSNESLSSIFSCVMEWFFMNHHNPSFSKPIQGMKDTIVTNTINIYQLIQQKFKPTPAKSHYTYNLRDVSKVFQGMTKSSPKAITKENDMVKSLLLNSCLYIIFF